MVGARSSERRQDRRRLIGVRVRPEQPDRVGRRRLTVPRSRRSPRLEASRSRRVPVRPPIRQRAGDPPSGRLAPALRRVRAEEDGPRPRDARDLARLLLALVEARHSGPVLAGGHSFSFDTSTEALADVTGVRILRIRPPAWLLLALGRTLDVVGKLTRRNMLLSRESISIVTGWQRVQDSTIVCALGVKWRPAQETQRDLFRRLVEAGRLPASAVPAIKAETGSSERSRKSGLREPAWWQPHHV